MIHIIKGLFANGMSKENLIIANINQQKPLKIRSMASLMGPAEFKERTLINEIKKGRFINGHVIHVNIKNPVN